MEAKVAFDSVCSKIAERYQQDGWKYAKSNHWMTKKVKNFKFQVLFYTSWNNISDKDVVFYGAFDISSSKTKKSYFSHGTCTSGIPKGKLNWNIAREEMWDEAIEEFTNWLETECFPIMEQCMNNLDEFVKKVVEEGFYPPLGYICDIDFVLEFGGRELAEIATKKYYESLDDESKMKFKKNYDSMINGGEAVNRYGNDMMLNPSEFRTVIENKIMVDLEMPDDFTIDEIDKYYDKALEAYCELYEISSDEINKEQQQEIYLYAGNHIGFFMTWLIKHDYISDKYKDTEGIKKVKEEVMTGTEYLIEYCNGQFRSDILADSIMPFIGRYYKEHYFKRYCDWVINDLCDLPMEFIGTWEEYHDFESVIDAGHRWICGVNGKFDYF